MRIKLMKRAKPPKLPADDGTKRLRHPSPEKTICPEEVIAERDRVRDMGWATLTAATFGDPKQGRSALDRRSNLNDHL